MEAQKEAKSYSALETMTDNTPGQQAPMFPLFVAFYHIH
jgi:hypothetical protein